MDRDYIAAPALVQLEFTLEPVPVQIESLSLINQLERLSGLDGWVQRTRDALTPEQYKEHILTFETVGMCLYHELPPPPEYRELPDYLASLRKFDAKVIADKTFHGWVDKLKQNPHWWNSTEAIPTVEALRTQPDTFVSFMTTVSDMPGYEAVWEEAYHLMHQPELWLERTLSHLNFMWEQHLKTEWHNKLPLLQESVSAFQRVRYEPMTLVEAIRAVTGREMGHWVENEAHQIDRIVFMPNPHLGPYISKLQIGSALRLSFGARLPRGVQSQPSALSRSELLIRMNALADDTRLRILEMLTQRDEMCAQDIIEALGLSQSSVSRHLSQLSATGFLLERRRDVNKCYSLNVDRVNDTVRALTSFLSR